MEVLGQAVRRRSLSRPVRLETTERLSKPLLNISDQISGVDQVMIPEMTEHGETARKGL